LIVSNSSEPFDPYRVWLGIPKAEQPPNHYRLLGVSLFESDPEVIQEGADRQVAHLKTKQTGSRMQLSQKLLQQVVAAVGCLLDEQSKAKYDRQLREKLKPAAAPAEKKAEKPAAAKPQSPPQPLPQAQPLPQPIYSQLLYQPPPNPYPPQQHIPQPTYRPIPVAVPVEETVSPEPTAEMPKLGGSFNSRSLRRGRPKNSGGELLKFAIAGGVVLIGCVIAWSVLSQSGLLADALKPAPVVATTPVKPKVIPKPQPTPVPQPAPQPQPATQEEPQQPAAEIENTPTLIPTTEPANPTPANLAPLPPASAPESPLPQPMPATPPRPGLESLLPSATPSAPSVTAPSFAAPTDKKLWRHSGGYIELTADGSWKELASTGDYFTLTPVGEVSGEMAEFDRPTGSRLRVFDNRLEQATGLGTFTEVAKGSWGPPADEIEMETPQQASLQRACQLYADSLAKVRRKLLDQFDEAMSSNRKRIGKADERLAVITILEAERARFEKEGLVPWSLPMQADTAKYLADLQLARGPSDALFQKVISHFVARKDLDTASTVDALKHKVLAPLVIAKLTKIDAPRPPPGPFGFNPNRRRGSELPDDDGAFSDDPRTGTIRLWSSGAVNSASGKSQWTIAMGNLQLQFMRPTFSLVDTITISERGDELSGKSVFSNKFSLNFTGRFENTLEPHEQRPEVKFNPKLKPIGAAEAIE
jgi:hypothetical protein